MYDSCGVTLWGISSDVNDAEPRLSFSEKNEPEPSRNSNKMIPSRDETLGN